MLSMLFRALVGPILRLFGIGAAAAGGAALANQRARAEVAEKNAQVQRRMQDARAKGPRTGDAAVDRLQRGKF
jgi:hypothetical protein